MSPDEIVQIVEAARGSETNLDALWGAAIGGGLTLLGTLLAMLVQKRNLDTQLQHEREMDVRGRRTEALSLLYVELESQADALSTLWGLCRAWAQGANVDGESMRIHPALGVLARKSYRRYLWPVNSQVTRHINEFAVNSHAVQSALVNGANVGADPEAVDRVFRAASQPLSGSIGDLTDLMSRINGIDIQVVQREIRPDEP